MDMLAAVVRMLLCDPIGTLEQRYETPTGVWQW